MPSKSMPRREIAKISIVGTTQMHLRNPMMIAVWSIMFPGLGHLLLSKYISGFIVYGYVLAWGPIAWGLIGMFIGFGAGLLIKLITTKAYSVKRAKGTEPEVILIIACSIAQKDMVKDLLWANSAMGVSQLSLGEEG